MKRIFITALALCLVFGLGTAEAEQKIKKTRKAPPKGSRTEKTEEMKKPQVIDKYPPMVFQAGVLNQEGLGGWTVGGMDLWLKEDCVITTEGSADGMLQDGRQAVVMGAQAGNTIVAWGVRVMKPESGLTEHSESSFQKEPGENPNVGAMTSRPD